MVNEIRLGASRKDERRRINKAAGEGVGGNGDAKSVLRQQGHGTCPVDRSSAALAAASAGNSARCDHSPIRQREIAGRAFGFADRLSLAAQPFIDDAKPAPAREGETL